MAFEDFFHTDNIKETNFFDEGPRLSQNRITNAVNTSSINTTIIDGYRQGVELTQFKHFDAGTVKIHAGEPGHVLKRNRYGMDQITTTNDFFQEKDYFNPISFLEAQESDSSLLLDAITFPIITSDSDESQNLYFDGIIEPLTIRETISFFSLDPLAKIREVKGAVMAGNSDSTFASDAVKTVDYFTPDKQQTWFLDLVDMIANQPMNGFFEFVKSTQKPFIDAKYTRNVIPSASYASDMIEALTQMTGSTDNYIRINQKSATCGWDYENNALGTDSIAFGGLTY